MLRKILRELILIRKELQSIRSAMEPKRIDFSGLAETTQGSDATIMGKENRYTYPTFRELKRES